MLYLLIAGLLTFEVSGKITSGAQAAVTLHAASSPFTITVLSDAQGQFRFKNIETGAYTLSAFLPGRGEVHRTIEVGPGTADGKQRVIVELPAVERQLVREGAATVSARELSVPSRARKEYEQAGKSLAKKQIDDAIRHLERAVEIAPQFSAAWNHLGTICYQTQQYDCAEQRFRRALTEDPEAYAPLVNLGGVLLNLGKFDEAWKFNVYAVLKRPGDALANSQLGMTYLALNKLELAEKHLVEASRIDPAHFSHPQLQLAEVYLRKGEMARAANQIEEFLRYHPDYPHADKMREQSAKLRAR